MSRHDGTVYVRTADGERAVGQYPEGSPEEALAFFTRRFDALAFEVQLLEQRVRAGALTPDEATESIKKVAAQLVEPHAVGDVVGLSARLDALRPADRRTARQAARGQGPPARGVARPQAGDRRRGREDLARARTGATASTGCATCSRSGRRSPGWRRRQDDELWHRFSGARTAYTRRRKAHFAELNEKREGARVVKERLLKEAESLSGSTEWGPTSTRYRVADAGLEGRRRRAPRGRGGRCGSGSGPPRTPSSAPATPPTPSRTRSSRPTPRRSASSSSRPRRCCRSRTSTPPSAPSATSRDRWDAAGKVPRDQMKSLEGRIRKVEQAIRSVEDDQWKRSDPEKSARADDMLGQLERAIAGIEADLEKARPRRRQRSGSSRRTSPRASSSSRWPARPPPTSLTRRPSPTGVAARRVRRPGVVHARHADRSATAATRSPARRLRRTPIPLATRRTTPGYWVTR